jgi:carbonic anhydrase
MMLRIGFIFSLLSVGFIQLNAEEVPKSNLQRLKEGNERFIKDDLKLCKLTEAKRESLVEKQNPFAVILGCADARVSPEIVFDQTIGDLFVVRVAGNIVGPVELDSIEFAALILGAKLIVVMGHENCGAVKAVLGRETRHIDTIAFMINPAIASVPVNSPNRLADSIKANVNYVVNQLKLYSPVLHDLVQKGDLEIVGAYYNLATGKVDFL